MSNSQNEIDLLQTGPETIAQLINLANGTSYVPEDLIIGAPRVSADENYNTDIEVTFPIAPVGGDADPDPVTGELHYPRLDLGRLMAAKNFRIRDTGTPYNNVNDLLVPLLEEARVHFDADDLVDAAIPAGAYPKVVLVRAHENSYRFIGQFSVEILAPIVPDTSFLVAPAEVANTTPAPMATKHDEQGNVTLFAGEGNPIGGLIKSTNGEIEVAGGARLYRVPVVFPPFNDKYNLHIGTEADWNLPFSFALIDRRNGDRLTDLYTCTVKITSAQTGGVLNFELKRRYGKLILEDTANALVLDDPAASNAEDTLYQDIQRLTFYKNKLGSLTLNAAGAPYGTFNIELKAVRKTGGGNPVVVTFDAVVDGSPAA